MHTLDGSLFTWKNTRGSAFASDLGRFQFDENNRVIVKSHRTGDELVFEVVEQIPTSDGEDVGGWRLKQVPTGFSKYANRPYSPLSNLGLFEITIWND